MTLPNSGALSDGQPEQRSTEAGGWRMEILALGDWPAGSGLSATISARFQLGVFRPAQHELAHNTPLRMLAQPASKGTINFSIDFRARQPRLDVFRKWRPRVPMVLSVDFECDESGDLS